MSRCQRLEQENEELAASADVAKGIYRLPLVCGAALRSSICLCAMRVFVEELELYIHTVLYICMMNGCAKLVHPLYCVFCPVLENIPSDGCTIILVGQLYCFAADVGVWVVPRN